MRRAFFSLLLSFAILFVPSHLWAAGVSGCGAPLVHGKCTVVQTALGPIQTDVPSLVNTVFRLLLSLSGGVATILIIAAGYQMVASQGNPEKVKEARERLISAIVGLLFIIFSTTILQIVGVDILRLPGFGK